MQRYLSFWGCDTPIFTSNLPFEKLFFPKSYYPLRDRLLLLARENTNLMVVTSPRGHGKSSLANWLYKSLSPATHEVIYLSLYNSMRQSGWLYPKLLEFFGKKRDFSSFENHIPSEEVFAGIDEVASENRSLTILIDEADKLLSSQSLEEIHSLISVKASTSARVCIILFGTSELLSVIDDCTSIKNRIAFQANFLSLSRDECSEYLNYRLSIAGLPSQVFEPEAIELIFNYSAGIYSVINEISENTLVEGFVRNQRSIDVDIVHKMAQYIGLTYQGTQSFQSNLDAFTQNKKITLNLDDDTSQNKKMDDVSSLEGKKEKHSIEIPKPPNRKLDKKDLLEDNKKQKKSSSSSIKLSSLFIPMDDDEDGD